MLPDRVSDADDRARSLAELGAEVVGDDLEFLDGLERRRAHGPVSSKVDAESIDENRLVADLSRRAHAADGRGEIILDSRREHGERREISGARGEGRLVEVLPRDGAAERGLRRLDQRRLIGDDVDRFHQGQFQRNGKP